MIEESAEPLASDDPACLSFWNVLDQPIAQSLMGPLTVVVFNVLRDRTSEMSLARPEQGELAVFPPESSGRPDGGAFQWYLARSCDDAVVGHCDSAACKAAGSGLSPAPRIC